MPSGYNGSSQQATCHPELVMHAKGLCKACYYKINRKNYNREYQKIYNKNNPTSKKRGHLKPLGWTLELFEDTLLKQHNKCAICEKPRSAFKKNFSVDHNHKSGQIRGLLCYRCNKFILGRQTYETVLKMKAYLEKYEGR